MARTLRTHLRSVAIRCPVELASKPSSAPPPGRVRRTEETVLRNFLEQGLSELPAGGATASPDIFARLASTLPVFPLGHLPGGSLCV